eukprot:6475982-Amphidinium_carterae.1
MQGQWIGYHERSVHRHWRMDNGLDGFKLPVGHHHQESAASTCRQSPSPLDPQITRRNYPQQMYSVSTANRDHQLCFAMTKRCSTMHYDLPIAS